MMPRSDVARTWILSVEGARVLASHAVEGARFFTAASHAVEGAALVDGHLEFGDTNGRVGHVRDVDVREAPVSWCIFEKQRSKIQRSNMQKSNMQRSNMQKSNMQKSKMQKIENAKIEHAKMQSRRDKSANPDANARVRHGQRVARRRRAHDDPAVGAVSCHRGRSL
ncbi:hypothetical protein M885DRAFT_119502 [Pelagophyceae sp. CCMP2097]|nr:hypothetical protein M885DRAFT_119502 [Pelagophyceae sp. CCMP2097]